jgi:hypothetical protein
MNGWKVFASLLCISIAVAAGPACFTGTDPESARSAEIEQYADGCGAFRYRGSANLTCEYRAYFDNGSGSPAAGVCLNDSQVQCTYPLRCNFAIDKITTTCVDDAANAALCWSQYPPEASDPVPQQVYVFDLFSGSRMCDPPASADFLRSFCELQNAIPRNEAGIFCRGATSTNSGSATCCLDCPTPRPLDSGPSSQLTAVCAVEDIGGGGSDF